MSSILDDERHGQVEANNNANAEEFAQCFDEYAVAARLHDGEAMAEGRDEIYTHWSELFQTVPEIHGELSGQCMVGNDVSCRKWVTGLDDSLEALAVSLAAVGVIQCLWLGKKR